MGLSLPFLVHLDDLCFDLPNVTTLKLVSVVLLSQQLQIAIHLSFLLIVQLLLHPSESMLLSLLGDSSLETLILDALLEQLNLVLVVGFDRIYHQPVLYSFLLLCLLVLLLLREQFVLLKLARKFVDFLAEFDLLSITLVVERLLVLEEFLLELPFFDGLSL